ncbi:ExbD/TolR family protein [Sulfitobacter aestuarii]|uniref:ExbD/TolR family protein n=1 Tax=Sulfitobacter aestuarii TaxID=2161676 RepID=A0ABW5U6W0_9RHOB
MNLPPSPRRAPSENMVPMINVVFLLLIFFLMTAQIAPPEPFEISPPEAGEADETDGTLTLHLSADGQVGFRDSQGDAALVALASARSEACEAGCAQEAPVLLLRADRDVPAAALAELMPRLGAAGFARIELLTARP